MTSVFRARGVSVSFGGVRAVAGVDLEIEAGELVGLIGPNGAGKTTFIDAITGFVRSAGTVELGETTLNGLPPHVRAQRGLDEPAAGLDARQSKEFGALLPGIARTGTAVLLVDHDMGLVLSVCDRVVV